MNSHQRLLSVPFFVSLTLLSACDWVDSAGSDAVSTDASTDQSTIVLSLDDVAVGESVAIDERTDATLIASRTTTTDSQQTFTWSSEPLAQGKLNVCLGQEGFSDELAVDSLLQACPMGNECELRFNPSSVEPGVTQFTLSIPALFASVGLTYQLSVEDGEGVVVNNEYSFCLIAVNDPPVANPDTFLVLGGDVLRVETGGDAVNLLSNDIDDEHISNSDFSVVPEASTQPENAAFFELGNDGSFTYEPDFEELQEDQTVGFQYQLTDGVSQVPGQVTIRVVATNQAPQLLTPLPAVLATEGEALSVDISGNFGDPDSDPIVYSLADSTPLAAGTGLEFSSDGVLSGTPVDVDVGSYTFTVIANDGLLSTQASLAVEIAAAPVNMANSAPEFVIDTVFDQTVDVGERITRVRPQFADEDNDDLAFSIAGSESIPDGVTFNITNGVLFGTPTEAGSFTGLRVRATDPSGASAVSTAFSIIVEEVEPVEDDVVNDEAATINESDE